MLAPDRLRVLIPDPRPIAAAAANPSATLMKELSAENQNDVFMLLISSVRRSTFQKGSRIFPASDLAKTDLPARSCRHETLELAERESPFDWTLCSHGRRGDSVGRRRTTVQMPEAYWAAIATLVVMQSSLGATLTLSIERVVATALGASVGAVEVNYFGGNLVAFMLAIFSIGLLSYGFRLERTAYRYASVTLTIIVLIPRTNPAWIVAMHRFIEVSVGIVVALAVVALWPERSAIAAKNAAE
jgi:Fusaric acid resistance protein-like